MYKSPTVGHRNAVEQNFAHNNTMERETQLTKQNINRASCKHAFGILESRQV